MPDHGVDNISPLTFSFEGKESYSLGERVKLRYRVTNHSNSQYFVLKWFTPLEGILGDILKITYKRRRIPYDGILIKRGQPSIDDYVLLKAGEVREGSIDVSASYSLSKAGVYHVTFAGVIWDLTKDLPDQVGKRSPEEFTRFQTPKSKIVLTVKGRGKSVDTEGQVQRKKEKRDPRNLRSGHANEPQIKGGSEGDKAATKAAHNDAYHYADQGRINVQQEGGKNPQTITWFGAYQSKRHKRLHGVYNDVAETLKNEKITYDFNGSSCQASWYAYTYKDTRTIYLCNMYIAAPFCGIDSKTGILIHELTHAVSGTSDHAYGLSGAKQLAINGPDKAVENADNYEYYIENLPIWLETVLFVMQKTT